LFDAAFLSDREMMHLLKRYLLLARNLTAVALVWLLASCASVRTIDSQVAAFSTLEQAPAIGSTWRFEQLPSQQELKGASVVKRRALEALAASELAKIGFAAQPLLDTTRHADYTVQLSTRIQRFAPEPMDAWAYPMWGYLSQGDISLGTGHLIFSPFFRRFEPPWYLHEVSLLIRDNKDSRVVYETQALHQGRWADDEALWPAMLAAALQEFPKPPAGKRVVNIQIPHR
jgi:hypothetical protein